MMKNFLTNSAFRFAIIMIVLIGSGCNKINDITQTLRDTNDILESALTDLNGNGENYANIIQDAIDAIDDKEIKAQLESVLNNAIDKVSAEVKCNIQFTVDYCKAEIQRMIADIKKESPPLKQPTVCSLSPNVIDMNLSPNTRNTVCFSGYFLNSKFSKYKLYLIHENGSRLDVTGNLSANSDFKLVVNLGGNGVPINGNSKKLALEWDGVLVSTAAIIQAQLEKCELRERTLTGLPNLVLYPEHKVNPSTNNLGDKEFNGHGPCTRGNITIYTQNNGRELWARGFVEMWECPDDFGYTNGDYTYGSVLKKVHLTTVDAGWKIKIIKGATTDNFQNIDNNHNLSETIPGGGPVKSYNIIGDTGGKDLGESRVSVSFNGIKVTLEEIGNCLPN